MAPNKLVIVAISLVLIIGGILNPFGALGCGFITLVTAGINYFTAGCKPFRCTLTRPLTYSSLGQVYAAPTIAILGYEFYAYQIGNKLFSMMAFVISIVYFAVCLIRASNNTVESVPVQRILNEEDKRKLAKLKESRVSTPKKSDDEGEVFNSIAFSAEREKIIREQRAEEERVLRKRFG